VRDTVLNRCEMLYFTGERCCIKQVRDAVLNR
jgi:hypothetical protein